LTFAARCLLIEDGNQLILIDTGMGNKQSRNGYYSLWGSHSLDKSLAVWFSVVTILQMFYDTLHFDHVRKEVCNKNKTGYEPAFKKPNFGLMKTTGNGQNQIQESIILVRKYFTNAGKRTTELY
jgi:glyoxylase-like metal-dependent hydrolase (beta-lactamase superfamily II)